jgi:hypothetical protein
MDRPLATAEEGNEECCRRCYSQRTMLTAVGSSLATGCIFVGVILLVRFADKTPGWSLLITAACALLSILIFLFVMNIIYCACPSYVAELPAYGGGSSGESSTDAESDSEPPPARPRRGRPEITAATPRRDSDDVMEAYEL